MEEKENEFWNIQQVSQYLQVKPKTIYNWAESGEIPYYKIGRLIRFKRTDIDAWVEGHRKEQNKFEIENLARRALKTARKGNGVSPDKMVKKIIDEVKTDKYTPKHGKSDQIKGLGKEVNDGIV